MKKVFIFILLIIIANTTVFAQGCVAIKGAGGLCTMDHKEDSSKWELNISTRYFNSYKHFVGTERQVQRETLGTNVINHSFQTDITLLHKLNSRWSMLVNLPIVANTRSSLYEHNNIGRYETHSFGAGDIRFAVYNYIIDPKKMPKMNLQVGLGIKLPTGNFNYQDYFKVTDSTTRMGAVDQSIQLGDGGTGITFELNGYYALSHKLDLYGNFYYLVNPTDVNGTSTARGGVPSTSAVKNGSEVMSVPDQFMVRGGLNYRSNNFTFSVGLREECLPVRDLIGGSNGFRRPGYILSAEPGISYTKNKCNFYMYLPIALVRDRKQSVPDQIRTNQTGVYTQGDAAFADYLVNIGFSIKL